MMFNKNYSDKLLYFAGLGGALCCTFLWSGYIVIGRLGVITGIHPVDLSFIRYFTAFVFMLPFIYKYWPRHIPMTEQIYLSYIGAGVPYALLSYTGFKAVTVAEAGIFSNGFIPVMTVLISYFFLKINPSKQSIIGILIILAGCIGLSFNNGVNFNFINYFGIGQFSLILSAIMMGAYIIVLKRYTLKAIEIVVMVVAYNGTLSVVIWLLFGQDSLMVVPYKELIIQGLYQGLGPSIIGTFCFAIAIKHFGSVNTAVVMAAVPSVATLFAIPILNEYPNIWGIIGIAFVTIGILLNIKYKNN